MRNRITAIAALVVTLLMPGYAVAQGELSQADVDDALERRREASATLEAMTARFEQAMADEAILREDISTLSRSVARLEREIGERRVQVRDLVRERYMSGGSLGTERIFTATTFTDIPVHSSATLPPLPSRIFSEPTRARLAASSVFPGSWFRRTAELQSSTSGPTVTSKLPSVRRQ